MNAHFCPLTIPTFTQTTLPTYHQSLIKFFLLFIVKIGRLELTESGCSEEYDVFWTLHFTNANYQVQNPV